VVLVEREERVELVVILEVLVLEELVELVVQLVPVEFYIPVGMLVIMMVLFSYLRILQLMQVERSVLVELVEMAETGLMVFREVVETVLLVEPVVLLLPVEPVV
jgi:hypothetical protein